MTLRIGARNVRLTYPAMMTLFMHCSLALFSLISPSWTAVVEAPSAASWHAQTLGEAVGYMALFAAVGILLAIVGYRRFAKCPPNGMKR